ncbi:hypothetical protein QCB49_13745 (plasmid) [Cetobacterium somerae]
MDNGRYVGYDIAVAESIAKELAVENGEVDRNSRSNSI